MFGNSENCGVGSENWETAKIMLEEYIYNEMLHSDDSSYGKLQMAAYMGKVVDEIEAGVGNTILSAILRAIKEKAKNPPEQNSDQHKPLFRMAEAVHSSADILCRKTARTILQSQPRQTA